MKLEAQRIAIAEACGWTKCRLAIKGAGAPERGPSPYGIPPGRNYEAAVTPYERDLNAMHEAEKVLTKESQCARYAGEIAAIVKGYAHEPFLGVQSYIWHSTAAQRAEAFLKTLNLWKE